MTTYPVAAKILRRIRSSRGSVWSPKDLLDLGTRAAVDQALKRLSSSGALRKVARGLYDYPQTGTLVGKRAPKLDQVARAAARSRGARISPTGAVAANALGLSGQVPARAEYITDGPSRDIEVGGRHVKLKRVSPKRLATTAQAGAVVEALKYLGRQRVENMRATEIRKVADSLNVADRRELKRVMHIAPDWMRSTLDAILSHNTVERKSK